MPYAMGTEALPHSSAQVERSGVRTPLRGNFLGSSEKPDSDNLLAQYGRHIIDELCQDGHLDRALHALCLLEQLGTPPTNNKYISFLRACHKRKALAHAKHVLEHLTHYRSNLGGILGDYLVITLAKCGGLEDALHLFHGFSQRSVYAWTAVISGFTEWGQGQEALKLHQHMKQEGVEPNHFTFVSLLKACGSKCYIQEGQELHAEVQKKGLASDIFVGSSLVSMYGKCGRLEEAEHVFFKLFQRNVVTWNGMLSAYVQQNQGEKALQLYRQMEEEGLCPNEMTFVIALQACSTIADKEEPTIMNHKLIKVVASSIGQALHAIARKKSFTDNIRTTLVSLYGKCLCVEEAENVFCAWSLHNVAAWNSMISTYAENGLGKLALQLCCHMQQVGISPDEWTFVSALQACGTITEEEESVIIGGVLNKAMSFDIGEALHDDAKRNGFASHIFVGNSLLTMYRKCGSLVRAESVFVGLSQSNLVSWNAMLSAYVDHGQEEMALRLYRQMQESEKPNEQTFTVAIHACGSLAVKDELIGVNESRLVALKVGQALHSDVWRKGVASSFYVGNTLISMYSKCGKIVDSEHAFQGLSKCNIVSWNTMLSAYVENGYGEKALQLFRQMLGEGVTADKLTFRTILQACATLAVKDKPALGEGHSSTKAVARKIVQMLHADAERMGLDKDSSMVNTLISVYSKCEMVVNASRVFEKSCQKNTMLYNVMLSTYVEHGLGEKALQLYRQIHKHCVADDVTLVYILQACSDLGLMNDCRELHFILISAGHDVNPLVSTTLIHAYGYCATLLDAETVFDGLMQPDVVSWSACIAGYAREGNHVASCRFFQDMNLTSVEANIVSFLSLLHACSHAGLIYKGVEYFESMYRDFGIRPDLKCYAGIIDLLGRAGDFTRVNNLLWRMPMQDDLPIWPCILSVCCIHSNTELARQAFDYAVSLQSEEATSYILMANICVQDGALDCK